MINWCNKLARHLRVTLPTLVIGVCPKIPLPLPRDTNEDVKEEEEKKPCYIMEAQVGVSSIF